MSSLREGRKRLVASKRAKARLGLWIINLSSIIAWALLVPAMLLVHKARPSFANFFDRLLDLEMCTEWDEVALLQSLVVFLFITIVAGLGLAVNAIRANLNNETYRLNLILIFAIALVSSLAALVFLSKL